MGFMERSAIKLQKKPGNTDAEIARVLGRDRKTLRRALTEPTDRLCQRLFLTSRSAILSNMLVNRAVSKEKSKCNQDIFIVLRRRHQLGSG